MNSINLTGRLTKDPELKTTPVGVAVCTFSIAVDRPNVKDKTDFINIVAWRNTAEFIAKYFNKGNAIGITGVLTIREYEDKNKVKQRIAEVVADNVSFIEGKKSADKPKREDFEVVGDDSDLPF